MLSTIIFARIVVMDDCRQINASVLFSENRRTDGNGGNIINFNLGDI